MWAVWHALLTQGVSRGAGPVASWGPWQLYGMLRKARGTGWPRRPRQESLSAQGVACALCGGIGLYIHGAAKVPAPVGLALALLA